MKLKLHDLKESVSFSFDEKEGWLRDVFTRLRLKTRGPLSLYIKVTKQDRHLFVEGHLTAALMLACSRCANELVSPVDEFFSPVFVHGKDPCGGETALEEGELNTTYFREDKIDLAEVMHEQIALMLPVQPLCRQKCKGLCPQCGQDLNAAWCGCKKERAHSQFDVLKTFKAPKKRG